MNGQYYHVSITLTKYPSKRDSTTWSYYSCPKKTQTLQPLSCATFDIPISNPFMKSTIDKGAEFANLISKMNCGGGGGSSRVIDGVAGAVGQRAMI